MHAIQIEQTGGPEVMAWTEVDDPVAGEGQLVVELAAAGLNYIDTYQRSGLYAVELPYVLGLEGAGTVAEVATSSTTDPTNPTAEPTLAVEIALDSVPDSAAALNELDVDVVIVDDLAAGATVVPASALVATADGGFAVEVVNGSTTTFVAVDPGMFADGFVEVGFAADYGPATLTVCFGSCTETDLSGLRQAIPTDGFADGWQDGRIAIEVFDADGRVITAFSAEPELGESCCGEFWRIEEPAG